MNAKTEGCLIPQHVDEDRKDLQLDFRAAGDTLASRNSGNEVRLNDVDSGVENVFETALVG